MKFSVTAFLVVWYICTTKAHPIEQVEISQSGEFKVHILERGTKFQEKIYIDVQNDIEYFKVPPHNGNIESDHLYDFRMNITVSRVKKDGVCHVSPLPDDLPRPDLLSQGLTSFSSTGQNATIKTVSMRWTRGPEVDKTILRKEVRDFCGQFPVYQLVPFNPDLVSAFNSGRVKRSIEFDYPLCKEKLAPGSCNPNTWLWSCKIRDTKCVYYLTCNGNGQLKKLDCDDLRATDHRFDSFVCCTPKCP